MLVLSRSLNEKIFIGPDIVITVVGTRSGGQARLGIDAPRDVPIIRADLVPDKEAWLEECYQRRNGHGFSGPGKQGPDRDQANG